MSETAPLDVEFPPLNLPRDCVENPDGSVTVLFDYPREVAFGATTRRFDDIVLRQIKGDAVLTAMQAKNSGAMMAARAAGLSPAQWHLVSNRLDASDVVRVFEAVQELLGGAFDNLPDYAIEDGETIVLPLRDIVTEGESGVHDRLTFRRLTGADLEALSRSKDVISTGLQRGTGLSAKAIKEMLPLMDGADVMAAQAVLLFLSGSGRKTGR